ncbi:MAG: UPF0149 family protein [Xanthomonadales bacterium]|nr:UPF0149 family protein [Xanthomonadales bacterium]
MSAPPLPDFVAAIHAGQGELDAAGLAECHGVLCGLLCRENASAPSEFLHHLAALELLVEPPSALASVLGQAHESTARQLSDEEFGFELWLPDDDEPLEDRAGALARWSLGFLAGLASGGQWGTLSEEAAEAIEDLQQIARTELAGGGAETGEEDEAAYAEIVEYVRIVALTMREEFRGPAPDEAIH